jgi:hypothetical protein
VIHVNENILANVYGLRTHPFSPTVDSTGTALNFDVFASSLDPQTDPRVLSYYFDVYDWARFGAGAKLKSLLDAAAAVPATSWLPISNGPLLILIVGADNTGRESLANLLVHVIGRQRPGTALFDVELADVANEGNVLTIAQYFVYSYSLPAPAPTQAEIAQVFEAVSKNPVIGTDTAYHNLFQIWKARIALRTDPPLALVLRGKVNRDTWRVVYNSTSSLFPATIVLTHQEDYAEGCFRSLRREGRNVLLIKSQFLDRSLTTAYVEWRLAGEREKGALQNALSPFTAEALEALYERGTRAGDTASIAFPIGFVNRTLSRAMDDKLAELTSSGGISTKTSTQAQREQLLIGEQEIRSARNALNFGR